MEKKPEDDSESLETPQNEADTGQADKNEGSLESSDDSGSEAKPIEDKDKPSGDKPKKHRRHHAFNVYLLAFLLLLVVVGVASSVYYFNGSGSKKPVTTKLASQPLSTDALKELANSDVTVGDNKQVLTVQSNAIFDGSVLLRGDVEVAGKLVVGDKMSLQGLNVTGQSTFQDLQVSNDLSVTHNAAVQGRLTTQGGLTVNGSTDFSGTLSVATLSVSNLQLNGTLSLTHHLAGGGGNPSRSSGSALGGGGTTSVNGSDLAGTVNINTGSSPAAGCFITVNFASRYSSTPHVVVTPVGSAAAGLNWYINRSSSNFSICTSNSAPAQQSFGFDYVVIG